MYLAIATCTGRCSPSHVPADRTETSEYQLSSSMRSPTSPDMNSPPRRKSCHTPRSTRHGAGPSNDSPRVSRSRVGRLHGMQPERGPGPLADAAVGGEAVHRLECRDRGCRVFPEVAVDFDVVSHRDEFPLHR